MVTLSPARANWPLLEGLELVSRGKVRDTYALGNNTLLLSEATDGISIFDFVLNATVPWKGIILNCMNHFWSNHLRQFGIPTHLVATGAAIDEHLPEHLRGNLDLQSRCSVIRRLDMAPVEFIYRSVLTGSAVSGYKKDGAICGHPLPPGLQDGDALPCILDTPTTKAEEGHDENMSFLEVREKYPQQTLLGMQIFQICSAYAESRGIKPADTKLEFGENGIVGDEIVTPDSSRFWDLKVWQESRKLETRKAPPPFDKQLVREWGIQRGVNKGDPTSDEDLLCIHRLEVPQKLIKQTTQTYRYIFWRLTGSTIERYLSKVLSVPIFPNVQRIQVVCGSESDLPIIIPVLQEIDRLSAQIDVSVVSCHRNPTEVVNLPFNSETDVVIAVGGKAFALPGVLDAFSHASGKDIPVIGVALGEPGSTSLRAAQLSIEEIPGTPVIMDEINGGVYTGAKGFRAAIDRVIDGELPPARPRTEKPVQWNVFRNEYP